MNLVQLPDVSIVVPAYNEAGAIQSTLDELSAYLEKTGLAHEIIVVDDGSTDETAPAVLEMARRRPAISLLSLENNRGKGAAVRRGVQKSTGGVVAFIDADLPYRLQNLGDALALVQSGSADLAIGARDLAASESDPSYPLARRFTGRAFSVIVEMFLVPGIPDTQCGLKVFSREAAERLFSESVLDGFGFDFEVLFLARKYGYRIQRIPVGLTHRHESKVRIVHDSIRMLRDLVVVRLNDRKRRYRPARRCPVCFAQYVKTRTQIGAHVVRECSRCRCRFLAHFPAAEELERLYQDDYFSSADPRRRGYGRSGDERSGRRTCEARLKILRRFVPPRSRVLEVGAGTGSFGLVARESYDYVGIDLSRAAVTEGRSQDLDLIISDLDGFLNTGPTFDAVCLFHVFEHLPDPHQALASIHDLLKPGGSLLLITPDTESLLAAVSGDRWVSYKFPEHLILYSRSALIELLEQSGFEVLTVSADYEHHGREFIESRLETVGPLLSALARVFLTVLPGTIPVNTGSVRVVARRRAGPPVEGRMVRATEPTHAG
jgi:dolichyl-phosphate beta-glucosyltransferase